MINKINIYTCPNGHQTITIDVHEGTTPMMMRCRQMLNEKHACTEMSSSSWYNCDQSLIPGYEWYKPDIKKVNKTEKDHVKAGGLLLRKLAKQNK